MGGLTKEWFQLLIREIFQVGPIRASSVQVPMRESCTVFTVVSQRTRRTKLGVCTYPYKEHVRRAGYATRDIFFFFDCLYIQFPFQL